MKTCKCGCGWPVFSHGYAKFCQHKRTDKKKPHGLKLNITTVKDFKKDPDFGFDNQQDLFAWLWQEAKDKNGIVICPYTKERLNRFYNTEMWYSCFAHVLPKGQYTYFKLNPKNIRVVFPEFHRIIDQGTSIDRINHPTWRFDLWDGEKEEMRIQYDLFTKQNLLA